jgi:hypothetical protein
MQKKRSISKAHPQKSAPVRTSRAIWAWVVALGLALGGTALWVTNASKTANVFAGLGASPRPLAPDTLQVADIAADVFGFKGTVTLRGVVAVTKGSGPHRFVMIDSREAKICKSTGCAKFYLPVNADPQLQVARWDEVDVRGQLVQGDRYPYFQAESVQNLGSIQ